MAEFMSETKDFLAALQSRGGAARNAELRRVVDLKEDRMRQWCRRHGLVRFDSPYWRITELGTARLKELS